jgi:hypothetical protein
MKSEGLVLSSEIFMIYQELLMESGLGQHLTISFKFHPSQEPA